VSGVRWEGYSHEEIYAAVHRGPGAAVSKPAEDAWKEAEALILRIDDRIAAAMAGSAAGWEGSAAEASRAAMTPLGQWALDAARNAKLTAGAVTGQGLQANYVRENMPEPLTEQRNAAFGAALTDPTYIFHGLDDLHAIEQDSANRAARAVELMNGYTDNSEGNRQFWVAAPFPPQVTVVTDVAAAGPGGPGVPGVPGASAPTPAAAVAPPPGGAVPAPPVPPGAAVPPAVAPPVGAPPAAPPGSPGAGPAAPPVTPLPPAVVPPVPGQPPGRTTPGPSATPASAGPTAPSRTPPPGVLPPARPGGSPPGSFRPVVPSLPRTAPPPSWRDVVPGPAAAGPRGPVPGTVDPDRALPPGARTTAEPPAARTAAEPAARPVPTGAPPATRPGVPGLAGAMYPPMAAGYGAGAERERRRPDYLLDDSGAFADDRWFPPAVITPDDIARQ
jgi:hypothetical protein